MIEDEEYDEELSLVYVLHGLAWAMRMGKFQETRSQLGEHIKDALTEERLDEFTAEPYVIVLTNAQNLSHPPRWDWAGYPIAPWDLPSAGL